MARRIHDSRFIFPSSPISFLSCTFPCPEVEGACGPYDQAGGLREAGGARCGKARGKGWPAARKGEGGGRYPRPRPCVTKCASRPGNYPGNWPNSSRKAVDCSGKGEIASLCTRKYRGKFPGNYNPG